MRKCPFSLDLSLSPPAVSTLIRKYPCHVLDLEDDKGWGMHSDVGTDKQVSVECGEVGAAGLVVKRVAHALSRAVR